MLSACSRRSFASASRASGSTWQAVSQCSSRPFSSTPVAASHIGREPIKYTSDVVTLTRTPTALSIQGPKGTTSVALHPFVKLDFVTDEATKAATLNVAVEDPTIKVQRQMWGTTRTLIYNAIIGMTEGYTVPLYLVGVGYRALLEAPGANTPSTPTGPPTQVLKMKLGHSHWITMSVPPHIKLEVPSPTKLILSCTDKHELGLFAAKIRQWRKPEVYKGKGVFIGNEQIRLKAVKKK